MQYQLTLILAISTAVGTTKVVTLPSGGKQPFRQLYLLRGDIDMDYRNDIDCDEFEKVNNLIEHRIALLRELRELEGDDSDDA